MNVVNATQYLSPVIDIARQAGDAIMEIYQRDFSIYEKQDSSPLTEADLAAHHLIVEKLESLSGYPILSEESSDISWEERKSWTTYWLVDPLDGTKEFVKKNGEFTVNIALIHNGEPILGVVYAPALQVTYAGEQSTSAFKIDSDGNQQAISAVNAPNSDTLQVVGSRSHPSEATTQFLSSQADKWEMVSMGSSLKLCLVAEGKAHLYPRLGPTSEWDTAAAHGVVCAAGGKVTQIVESENGDWQNSGNELRYNQKESLLNPYFLVSA